MERVVQVWRSRKTEEEIPREIGATGLEPEKAVQALEQITRSYESGTVAAVTEGLSAKGRGQERSPYF